MGLTIAQKNIMPRNYEAKRNVARRFKTIYLDITFDSSYATGGEALDLRPYFNGSEPFFVGQSANLGNSGYRVEYDTTNHKLLAYTSGGTQVSNATDLSALVVRLIVEGIAK